MRCPVSVYHRTIRFVQENMDLDPVTLVSLWRSLIDCNNGGRAVFKLPDWTLHTRGERERESRGWAGRSKASVIYKPWSEVIAEARHWHFPYNKHNRNHTLMMDWFFSSHHFCTLFTLYQILSLETRHCDFKITLVREHVQCLFLWYNPIHLTLSSVQRCISGALGAWGRGVRVRAELRLRGNTILFVSWEMLAAAWLWLWLANWKQDTL